MKHSARRLGAALVLGFAGLHCVALPTDDEAIGKGEYDAYALCWTVWRTHEIPVCWENPTPDDDAYRAIVQSAVEETWSAHADVHFTGWGPCGATSTAVGRNLPPLVRIQIADDHPHVNALGVRLNYMRNGVVLNFAFVNWQPSACGGSESSRTDCIRKIAVHEFGHVLGFAHEQNRPDTPSSCHDQPQGTDGDELIGPWDASSVMNYCNPDWLNDGQLSDGDVFAAQLLYGAPSADSAASTNQSPSGNARVPAPSKAFEDLANRWKGRQCGEGTVELER